MSYTKRKWKRCYTEDTGYYAIEPEQKTRKYQFICSVISNKDDAQLIAAAPELLEACKAALEFIGRSNKTDWDNEITPILESAISTAEQEVKP